MSMFVIWLCLCLCCTREEREGKDTIILYVACEQMTLSQRSSIENPDYKAL